MQQFSSKKHDVEIILVPSLLLKDIISSSFSSHYGFLNDLVYFLGPLLNSFHFDSVVQLLLAFLFHVELLVLYLLGRSQNLFVVKEILNLACFFLVMFAFNF